MQEFEMIKEGGHLLLSDMKNLWVLDTGSPNSFGELDAIKICGNIHSVSKSYMGLDAKKLSDSLQFEVAGLIGGDILSDYDTHWDCMGGIIRFSHEEIIPAGDYIDLDFFMGIPTVSVKLLNETQTWFFDTGANICYVTEQPDDWVDPVGEYEDFYPGYGKFQTEIFQAEICIKNFLRVVSCGVLPELLGLSLSLGGCNGILGMSELLETDLYYSPRNRKLLING